MPDRPILVRLVVTLIVVALAVLLGWLAWRHYLLSPWTRDGRVQAYVVDVAPDISGRVVDLRVEDNQFVDKGALLFVIDPDRYRFALSQAEAALAQQQQNALLRQAQAARRARLNSVAVSQEEREQYAIQARMADAAYREAQAALDLARLDMARTEVRAPVAGWVTNLKLQVGDYASEGKAALAVVDTASFWVAGYFEETKLPRIRVGQPARIELMGYAPPLRGHVESIGRGIADPNTAPNERGLPNVNPVFTWVRLPQRIPVRIHIDEVPRDVVLAVGMTCTVVLQAGGEARPRADAARAARP